MPKFQIVMPHDPAECIQALMAMRVHDPEFQSGVFYGCHFGDCTGYALIEASSEEEARSKIPRTLLKRARIVEVEHLNPDDIVSAHDRAT